MKQTRMKLMVLCVLLLNFASAYADNFGQLKNDLKEPMNSQICTDGSDPNSKCQKRFTYVKPPEKSFWQNIKKVLDPIVK
jgi:hypothetical protein